MTLEQRLAALQHTEMGREQVVLDSLYETALPDIKHIAATLHMSEEAVVNCAAELHEEDGVDPDIEWYTVTRIVARFFQSSSMWDWTKPREIEIING
jgi:hypothetical protein